MRDIPIDCIDKPAWRSATIVFEQPIGATYLVTDRGWHYYTRNGETLVLRAHYNRTN